MVNHWNAGSGGPDVQPLVASEGPPPEIESDDNRARHVEKLMSERELSGVGRAIARVLSLAPDLSDQEGLDAFASMPGEIRACQNDLDVILSHAGGPDGLFDILPARGAIFVVGLSLHLKSVTNGNEFLS